MKYDELVDYNNLLFIYNKITKKMKNKNKLIKFELDKFSYLMLIYDNLKRRCYIHHKYNIFLIKRPKYRIGMSENIFDKIVDELVSYYVLIPILDKRILNCSLATRKNYGIKYGVNLLKKYLNNLKNKKEKIYILKCDITGYFYNINQNVLYSKLEKIIDDKDILILLKEFIFSTNEKYINNDIDKILNTEQNKKIYVTKYLKGYGLPIGNMSSQILANFYLSELDHYIKEQLYIKYYIRYMDDFILLHEDKDYLKICKDKICKKLNELSLKLNNKTMIIKFNNNFTFLGYKFGIKNNKICVMPSNKIKKIIRKRKKKEGKEVINNYKGYFKMCNNNKKFL